MRYTLILLVCVVGCNRTPPYADLFAHIALEQDHVNSAGVAQIKAMKDWQDYSNKFFIDCGLAEQHSGFALGISDQVSYMVETTHFMFADDSLTDKNATFDEKFGELDKYVQGLPNVVLGQASRDAALASQAKFNAKKADFKEEYMKYRKAFLDSYIPLHEAEAKLKAAQAAADAAR